MLKRGWESVWPRCSSIVPTSRTGWSGSRAETAARTARGQAAGVLRGADQQGHPPPGHLPVGDVDRGDGLGLGETAKLDVREDAHDFALGLGREGQSETLADGALAGPEALRHRLADEHGGRRVDRVGGREIAALEEADAQRRQGAGRDDANRDLGLLGHGDDGAAVDGDGLRRSAVGQRQRVDRPRRLDAGKGSDALEKALEERGPRGRRRVLPVGKREPRMEDVLRLEAGVHALETAETPDEEARAEHQDEREGDLGHDQGVTQHGTAGVGVGAAALLEGVIRVRVRELPGRQKPGEDAREDREAEREREDGKIDPDVVRRAASDRPGRPR